jgi:hypothetical protein
VKRIIMHWSAGAATNQNDDKDHYHRITTREGKRVFGNFRPEANLRPQPGKYAAHTLNLNTASIGHAMDAMRNAQERPFDHGPEPITKIQLDEFARWIAEDCRLYRIPVTRETVLSHAEVQPTLKVAQRGKWDICWLPGMDKPGDPVAVGDVIRDMVRRYI